MSGLSYNRSVHCDSDRNNINVFLNFGTEFDRECLKRGCVPFLPLLNYIQSTSSKNIPLHCFFVLLHRIATVKP
jgi:hypothetical protein